MKFSHRKLRLKRKYLKLIYFFSFILLILSVPLFVIQSQKPNQIQSRAQGVVPIQEPQCTSQGGQCQTGKLNEIGKPCSLSSGASGTVKYNFCPTQEGDIRCCVPNPVTQSNTNMVVTLDGIGPNAVVQSPARTATIKIFDNNGSLDTAKYTARDVLNYDPASGTFVNPKFNLGAVPDGSYQMIIQIEKYIDEQLISNDGANFTFAAGATIEVRPVRMRAGDIAPSPNGDNYINIIDYNVLIGCLPGAPANACLNKKIADLNDDGKVDQIDLNILQRNFGDTGFFFQTAEFKCEPDPTCDSGKNTLQLCSLLCTRKTKRA